MKGGSGEATDQKVRKGRGEEARRGEAPDQKGGGEERRKEERGLV
jgi:hypothetical protein